LFNDFKRRFQILLQHSGPLSLKGLPIVVTWLHYWLLHEGFAMKITTLSSREFNQDTSRAKKAATEGPVFITDRGTPAHVLLSIEEYQRLTGGQGSIIDRLGLPPGIEDVEHEIPPMRDLARPADFT
jgi:prevent-host-death family protein